MTSVENKMAGFQTKRSMGSLFRDKTFLLRNQHWQKAIAASVNKIFLPGDERARKNHYAMSEFINAADHMGNTAMHMAVFHRKKASIDWLMGKEEGKHSLELMNHDGFTPLTLAARLGHVEIFQHLLYKHYSKVIWTYGKVHNLPYFP